MNLQRVRALSKKELIRVVREPANLFMVIIFPIVLTLAFGFAFGALGSGEDVQYIVGVVDNDATDLSAWFQGNITNTGVLTIVQYVDQDSAFTDLETGGVSAVLVIPDGFGVSIEGFQSSPDSSSWSVSTLELAVDQGSMIVGSIVPAIIQQTLTVTLYGEEALSPPSPVVIGAPTLIESVKLTQFDYMIPGMFSYSAIFISLIVAQVFTEERNTGILDRIATTPTTVREIFTSLIFSNLITGTVQAFMVFVASYLMGFRPQGGLMEGVLALAAVLLLVVTNVGFGLITASISKSSSAATGIGFIFILPQMLLGSFIPAPASAARLVPSYYVSDTLTSLFLRGASAGSVAVFTNLAILTAYSLAVASIGVIISSRYLRR